MDSLYHGGTAGSLIIGAVIRHGDRPAIGDGTISWTYAQLGEAIGRYIAVFKGMGLARGQALSILASNRAESWAAMCAGLVMGMRYTPLHPLAA